jgi:glycosyltransferase involved in cell wall biosynthesis
MNKLIVCIMGQNCEKFIGMCLESVKGADAIVYCDGGSEDGTMLKITKFEQENQLGFGFIKNIGQEYNQEDKEMNGKQRNFYLNYLKENYPNDWAICLDADEVCEDVSKIRDFIQVAVPGLYSVKMRHFIGDLGHEDAITPEHVCLNRLFKISEAGSYPLVEHPVLTPRDLKEGEDPTPIGIYRGTTIWHLAYIPNLWDIKRRYDSHLKKSNMHTPEYLHNWYKAHLFGQYPKSDINLTDIPGIILKEFGIDKDELYFANRGIELKHPLMVKQWNAYFRPISVLDLGCGRGPYLFFWNWFTIASGIEISKYAVDNAFVKGIRWGSIVDEKQYDTDDLIIAFDVLEHLTYEELDKTLENMNKHGEKFLISVPFRGTPNCDNDSTHKIKETKEWWIEKLGKYMTILETPKDWLFNEQIIIGEKK